MGKLRALCEPVAMPWTACGMADCGIAGCGGGRLRGARLLGGPGGRSLQRTSHPYARASRRRLAGAALGSAGNGLTVGVARPNTGFMVIWSLGSSSWLKSRSAPRSSAVDLRAAEECAAPS